MHVLLLASVVALAPQEPQEPIDPIEALEGVQRPDPLPIPRAIALARAGRRIVIDGSLQDWPPLPPIELDDVRQVSGTAHGAFRSVDDLAGRVFVMWDEDDLYVAASVLDDWHVALKADSPRVSEIPPADNLLITIDPLRDSRSYGLDPGRAEDAEFWLAEVAGQEGRVVRWDRLGGVARFAQGGTAVVRRDDERKTTTYEARLPWHEILPSGLEPKAGLVVDVQFVLSDYDEPTDVMPQTRIGWNFGMGPRIDHWLLGSLQLLDAPAGTTDLHGLQVPPIDPPDEPEEPPARSDRYWLDLHDRIVGIDPLPVLADTPDPAFVAGAGRRDALRELDRRIGDFPRVDFLEFLQRIHRRMNRECAGIVARGLPFFWESVLEEQVPRLAVDPPERGFRIHRLPQNGWVVRSRSATFAIDPAGYGLDRHLFDQLDFVLLTRPLEIAERHDQLLLRMTAARPHKRVVTHIALHLPGVDAREFPLVTPGQTYEIKPGIELRVLGTRDDEGFVSRGVAYHVIWSDGSDLLVSGTSLNEADVVAADGVDALLLSVRHPRAAVVGQRIVAGLTVLDDCFECSAYAGDAARVRIDEVWTLQDRLRPRPSLLLAPGEATTIPGPAQRR